jgi:hypothetical protein
VTGKRFVVQWTVTIEASDHQDAMRQARDWGTSGVSINIDRDCTLSVVEVPQEDSDAD